MNKEAARFFHACLNSTVEEARQARAYWRRRGLDDKTIVRFGLGYAPNDGQALYQFLRDKGYNQQELDGGWQRRPTSPKLPFWRSWVPQQSGRAASRTAGAGGKKLRSGEMDQIKVPYSAGGSQALGIASAQQRLLAAILREPRYLELAKQQLTVEQFIQPQQKELYEAMLNCSREGVELSLTALRAFVSEEALNELSRLAAQYSDVNCTPDDIRLYLDRIARGMPVASKAAAMSGDEITQYLQSMREKKAGDSARTRLIPVFPPAGAGEKRSRNHAEIVANGRTCPQPCRKGSPSHPDPGADQPCHGRSGF